MDHEPRTTQLPQSGLEIAVSGYDPEAPKASGPLSSDVEVDEFREGQSYYIRLAIDVGALVGVTIDASVREPEKILLAIRSLQAALAEEQKGRALQAALIADLSRIANERQAALDEAKKPIACSVCLGQPLKSGRPCICGGVGTEQAEMHGLRVALFDAQAALGEAKRREDHINGARNESNRNSSV